MDYKGEIREYVISIFVSIFFLIIGTIGFKRLQTNYNNAQTMLSKMNNDIMINQEVLLKDVKKSDSSSINNIKSYRLSMKNNEDDSQKFYISIINNKYSSKISNNYIKYVIKKNDGNYSDVRSLSMNGNIYFDSLEANSEASYEIKVWISETYQEEVSFTGSILALMI